MSSVNETYVNPSACSEKPWDQWINEIGHSSPEADAEPPPEDKTPKGRKRKIAKLKWNTMSLHGFFPQMDNMNAAVCYLCGSIVKTCAAHRHLEDCHPDLPPPATVPKASTSRSRHRRDIPATLTSPLAQPSASILTTADIPVVSIKDPGSPLVDVVDDIFKIMYSEGIRSADDMSNADWGSIVRDIEGTPVEIPTPTPTPPKQTKSRPRPRDYDPDKHCGVLTVEAKPCVRSLTCKAHPISMRRSVEGRSKPFDQLLADKRALAAAGAVQPQVKHPAKPLSVPLPPPKVSPPIQVMPSPVQSSSSEHSYLANLPTISVPDELLADTPAELLQQADDLYGALLAAQDVIPPEVADLVTATENCLQGSQIITPIDSVLPILETPFRPARLSTPEEEKCVPPSSPAAVWWYGTSPRPLAVCTFGATSAGGAVVLGRRYARVRSDFKASLSRGVNKAANSATRARNKTATPEIRRLVVAKLNGQISHKSHSMHYSLDPLLDDKC